VQGASSALRHWKFDSGAIASTRAPVPLASASEREAAQPYFRTELAAEVANGSVRWWARANEHGGFMNEQQNRSPHDTEAVAVPAGRPGLLCVWRVDTQKCIDASPLIVERFLPEAGVAAANSEALAYIGSHSGEFLCVDIRTGSMRWTCQLPDRLESSAAISASGKLVFVGCYDGSLYAVNAESGTIAWSSKTGGEVKAAPCVPAPSLSSAPSREGVAVAAESVWVGSFDKCIYALDANSGALLLRHTTEGAFYSSATSSAGLVLCANLKGQVFAFEAEAFKLVWSVEVGHAIFASLRVDEAAGIVLVGAVDGLLRALSLGDGSQLWACDSGGPIFATPCVHRLNSGGSVYYAGSQAGHVLCVSANGLPLWRARGPGGGHSAPSTFGELLIVGSADGALLVLSATSGAELATIQLPGAVHSSPVVYSSRSLVLVGCRDNSLYCFKLTTAGSRPGRQAHDEPLDGACSPAVELDIADAAERSRQARLLVLSRVLGNLTRVPPSGEIARPRNHDN